MKRIALVGLTALIVLAGCKTADCLFVDRNDAWISPPEEAVSLCSAEEACEPVSPAPKRAPQPGKLPSTSVRASQPARKRASQPARKLVVKPARKRVVKPARKRVVKPAPNPRDLPPMRFGFNAPKPERAVPISGSVVAAQPKASPQPAVPGPVSGVAALAHVRVGQTWAFECKSTIPTPDPDRPGSIIQNPVTFRTEWSILAVTETSVRYLKTKIQPWTGERRTRGEKTWSMAKELRKLNKLGQTRAVPRGFRPGTRFEDESIVYGDLTLETVLMVQEFGPLSSEMRFASANGQAVFPGLVEIKSMSTSQVDKLVSVRQP